MKHSQMDLPFVRHVDKGRFKLTFENIYGTRVEQCYIFKLVDMVDSKKKLVVMV